MFKWNKKYETGIAEIDNQHRKLVSIGAKLEDMFFADNSIDQFDYIVETINELKDYTHYHFRFEEEKMQECGYGNLEQHQMEHLYFIKRIDKISIKDIDENQREIIEEALDFLSKWLFSHILKVDMQYVDLMKNVI